jgi:hypothetical protein
MNEWMNEWMNVGGRRLPDVGWLLETASNPLPGTTMVHRVS